ncbi:hypothetical protein KR009_003092, partial [Drosophila setifemur]
MVASIHGGVYSTDDKWVIVDRTADLPEGAVLDGMDPEGYRNYVGRVYYSSNVLPARVVAELNQATYNTDTLSNKVASYEILVGNATMSYHWIRSFDGYREKNAVSVGTNSLNDRVFICRARSDESVFIGTLYLAKRMCIIKYENLPLRQFDKYEILVRQRKAAEFMPFGEHNWVAGNISFTFPRDAIEAGYDPTGLRIYVGRVMFFGTVVPARVVADTGIAYYNNDQESSYAKYYEILVSKSGMNYVWMRSFDGLHEQGAVAVGTSKSNELVYICRSNANGGLLLGSLFPRQKLCFIQHDSLPQLKFEKYEVLVAQ